MEWLQFSKQDIDYFVLIWFWPKESRKGVWNFKRGWKLKRQIADKRYPDLPKFACEIFLKCLANPWTAHTWERDAKDTRVETATRNLKEVNKGNYVILYLKIGGSWKMPQAFSGNKTNHLKSKGNISELKN